MSKCLLTLNLLEDELAFDDIFCVTGGIVSINAVDIVVISKNKSSTKLVINLFNVVIRIQNFDWRFVYKIIYFFFILSI